VLHLAGYVAAFGPDLAVAALAGPLAAAGGSKLLNSPDQLAWPLRTGVLRAPRGPRLVGAAEVLAAASICVLPARAAAAVAFVAYAALTVAAYALRGQPCTCFGLARLAAVGKIHIALDACAGLVGLLVAAAGPASAGLLARSAVAAVTTGATLGLVLLLDRRQATGGADCTGVLRAVRLYVSPGCPACLALEHVLDSVEPARRAAVAVVRLDDDVRMPDHLVGQRVPCAVALSPEGEEICDPVSGIGPARALIDRITIGPVRVSSEER
jgi:hypothetical protein